jgi:hypothetical protein
MLLKKKRVSVLPIYLPCIQYPDNSISAMAPCIHRLPWGKTMYSKF